MEALQDKSNRALIKIVQTIGIQDIPIKKAEDNVAKLICTSAESKEPPTSARES